MLHWLGTKNRAAGSLPSNKKKPKNSNVALDSVHIFGLCNAPHQLLLLILIWNEVVTTMSFLHVLITLGMVVLESTASIYHLTAVAYGKDFVYGWNQLRTLEERLGKCEKI